jgi:hypothetical protein
MKKQYALAALLLSVACADKFEKAERELDNPSGSIEDSDRVTLAVQGGAQQDASFSVIDDTSNDIIQPFANAGDRPELAKIRGMLSRPEFSDARFNHIRNLLGLGAGATPFAIIETSDAGTIDVAGATGGACQGSITFSSTIVVEDNLFGSVESDLGFNQVACGNDAVDGDIAVRFELSIDPFNLFSKLVEIVDATITIDGVSTDVDFALRLETQGLTELALDMSVAANGDTYTLQIDGSLATGQANIAVVGADGAINCSVSNNGGVNTAACDGNLTITF